MKLAERYAGKTVLAVGAHADDVELAVGGTIARLRRGGARVVMVVVSLPGDYKQRMGEAKSAAEILGCAVGCAGCGPARTVPLGAVSAKKMSFQHKGAPGRMRVSPHTWRSTNPSGRTKSSGCMPK